MISDFFDLHAWIPFMWGLVGCLAAFVVLLLCVFSNENDKNDSFKGMCLLIKLKDAIKENPKRKNRKSFA